MSEELISKKYTKHGENFGNFEFYNLGATTILSLIKYKIVNKISNKEYLNKKPDAIIVDRRDKKNITTIAVIEYKKPSELNTTEKKEKAIRQCLGYSFVLSSKIAIITDGMNFYWINPNTNKENSTYSYFDKELQTTIYYSFIEDEKGNTLNSKFDSKITDCIDLINKILSRVSNSNNKLQENKFISPALLAKQVWQSIWLATGDDPKKCLMTFTELFIYKFLSDLKILSKTNDGASVDFETVMSKDKDHCLKYYQSIVRPFMKELFPASVVDKTTIINGLSLKKDQNQDNLFYDILQSFKSYGKLGNIDPNFKSRLFEDFLKGTTGKKQLAQFFTPRNVIKAIVEMANVKDLSDNASICDPAGGVGGFIIESILNRKLNGKDDFYYENGKIKNRIRYLGYDYDELTIILAKANLLIAVTELLETNPTQTKEVSKILNSIFELSNKTIIGSLANIENTGYDLVMSNPPYISKGLSLYRDFIKNDGSLNDFYNINSVGKEGLFVQKIIKELKKDGRAFIIIPDGLLYRQADSNLKKFILDTCYIECIISLPEKTFYATTKKTYIIGLRKKFNGNDKQNFKVLCGIVNTIGESLDVNRLPTTENDLNDFVREYKIYGIDKNHKPNNKKIKLLPITHFIQDTNWIIENYWDSKEKIDLGLQEPSINLSDEDLYDNIEYIKLQVDKIKNALTINLTAPKIKIYEYLETNLLDERYFKTNTQLLGYTKKEYSEIDTSNTNDIPIYTATLLPVAYIKKASNIKPLEASYSNKHISFASDGDGTAGTNIVLHDTPYYLNTSRISFEIINENILSEYIYYYLQDIKSKYGFDYKHKANINNIRDIKIYIPLNKKKEIDISLQKEFIENYKKVKELEENLITDFFKKVKEFEIGINQQLQKKIKENFNIE